MVTAILFDFFGVFCADLAWEWFAEHEVRYHLDRSWLSEKLNALDLGKITQENFYRSVAERTNGSRVDAEKQINSYVTMNVQLVTFVEAMKPALKIGLISNGNAEWVHEILKRSRTEQLFNSVTISSDYGFTKPDHRLFAIALKNAGVDKASTIFIDDREENTKAAEEFGMRSIVFPQSAVSLNS